MTPEEYEKFKEAEKAHLRKLREIKQAHHQASRKASVTRAVTDMASSMNHLFDENQEMVERLQMGTFQSEARLDVAMDSIEGDDRISEAQDAAQLELDQEAIRKAKAQELVRQMKMEGGAPLPNSKSDSGAASSSSSAASTSTSSATSSSETPSASKGRTPLNEKPKPTTSSNLPEKTIGKMKP